ncbi:hypothetical protein ILUMI_05156 [Ignelater luminosus]|uniref:Cathepsin L n=1 Tax=Ignelater luminosus TaxID=2038154 RepID=A0A8K0DBI2_IGNLU|nr:hypothetical protein ILUMI_05156 [Ignelater luminosus]
MQLLLQASFNKTYNSFEEDRQRREVFIENRNKIARFNQEYGDGRHTFVLKMNQYGDLLNHEFGRLINGFNRTNDGTGPERKNSAYIAAANVAVPTHVDWREVGAVSPVKRQGMCGACYAFSAAGAIEGQTFRKTGRLVELSPQNLIDCTKSYSNKGCASGVMEYSYEYVRDNRGIDTEQFYPYEGTDAQECRYRHDGYGAHVTGNKLEIISNVW